MSPQIISFCWLENFFLIFVFVKDFIAQLQNFEKVLSKIKFGEIYHWENCMQLMQKYFWCHINFCVTKCYLFKRRLKCLTSRSPPYKDIKGWNQEMNLYLIAMWFCHSWVKYHFMSFVTMQKFVTEWVSATYLVLLLYLWAESLICRWWKNQIMK